MESKQFCIIFEKCIADYHISDNVDTVINNEFEENSFDFLLYKKCWIDTVQWHLEDIIRDPAINPVKALEIKRRIDKSNQNRTDLVEKIDDFLLAKFQNTELKENYILNTETPAWAIDRLSILHLKIYHMQEETVRKDATDEHKRKTTVKLNILLQQKQDLTIAIEQLIRGLIEGTVVAKTYKQMKMYNDSELNPVLRKNK